ncbi:Thioesterase/thiol ester dehydrase-isomerase [Neoconidiobolus thromboides FSU 785]|nr:Thioesterase/thiol ester dehydrase-isomerase [Neoconidiobolus thromboides FSU 785]
MSDPNTQRLNRVQNAVEMIRIMSSYTDIVLPEYFETIEADKGRIVQEFIVEKRHLNGDLSIHGGFLAYLVDVCGTYAILTLPKDNVGVSVDINISYLAGAKVGEKIRVESRVDKIGRSLAFTSVELSKVNKDNKKVIVALGRHTKFLKGNTKIPSKL